MNNVHLQKTRENGVKSQHSGPNVRETKDLKTRKNKKPSSLPSAVSKALAGLAWSGCLGKMSTSAAQAAPPWLRAPCCQPTSPRKIFLSPCLYCAMSAMSSPLPAWACAVKLPGFAAKEKYKHMG